MIKVDINYRRYLQLTPLDTLLFAFKKSCKFENGWSNPLLTEKTLHLYGKPHFDLKIIRCLSLLGWRPFTKLEIS
jgi:hypothetical protein